MNPEHLALATQELSTLLSKGLIEPTTSPWACEAFYVNKHAEQVQGKLRLVVVHSCLRQVLIRHEWGASLADVGLHSKSSHVA